MVVLRHVFVCLCFECLIHRLVLYILDFRQYLKSIVAWNYSCRTPLLTVAAYSSSLPRCDYHFLTLIYDELYGNCSTVN